MPFGRPNSRSDCLQPKKPARKRQRVCLSGTDRWKISSQESCNARYGIASGMVKAGSRAAENWSAYVGPGMMTTRTVTVTAK